MYNEIVVFVVFDFIISSLLVLVTLLPMIRFSMYMSTRYGVVPAPTLLRCGKGAALHTDVFFLFSIWGAWKKFVFTCHVFVSRIHTGHTGHLVLVYQAYTHCNVLRILRTVGSNKFLAHLFRD